MIDNKGRLGATKLAPAPEQKEVQVPGCFVEVRGRTYKWPITERAPLDAALLALVALDDERVDKVLKAFGLTMQDHEGRPVFPPNEEA